MTKARLPYIVIAFMVLTLTAYDVWKLAAFWSATHRMSVAAAASRKPFGRGREPGASGFRPKVMAAGSHWVPVG